MIIRRLKLLRKEFVLILIFLACFLFPYLIMINMIEIGSINNISLSSLVSANILPLILIFLFLLYESGILYRHSKSYFEVNKNGLIHIPIFDIYFSIFESKSIHLVNNQGLCQLIDLELFSMEIDNDTKSLRVFLFSNNKKSQINRIMQFKPLLETIFPDILLMSPKDTKKLLTGYTLAEIAGFSIIQGKESFFLPVLGSSKFGQSGDQNKLVFAFNSSGKSPTTSKHGQTSQIYTLNKCKGSADFDLIGNIILKKNDDSEFDSENKNSLLRAIIRFQLNQCNLISFHQGVSYIQKRLSELGVTNQVIASEIITKDKSKPIDTEIESELPLINIDKIDANPICLELCNIHKNSELDETNRSMLCRKRITFCKKLVHNKNFSSLLMEITKKDDDKRKSRIFSDLLVHLSFHQIYCLIAQFIYIYEGKDLDVISIQLIHILITNQAKNLLNQGRMKQQIQKPIQDNQIAIT